MHNLRNYLHKYAIFGGKWYLAAVGILERHVVISDLLKTLNNMNSKLSMINTLYLRQKQFQNIGMLLGKYI